MVQPVSAKAAAMCTAPVPTKACKAFQQPAKAAAMCTAPVPTKAFQQPAKAAVMCTAPQAETCPPPSISWPALFASTKPIFKTDNMRPKSDNAIWHHRVKLLDGVWLDLTGTCVLQYNVPLQSTVIQCVVSHMKKLEDIWSASHIDDVFTRLKHYFCVSGLHGLWHVLSVSLIYVATVVKEYVWILQNGIELNQH